MDCCDTLRENSRISIPQGVDITPAAPTNRPRPLRTADLAKAAGVHPNTVRLYEAWGFLPPVTRAPNGYRLYAREHLDQMLLARLALHGGWPGREIRRSALALVKKAASGDLREALIAAEGHLALVREERARAEAAAEALARWPGGAVASAELQSLRVKEAAAVLGATPDQLRNWEKNGLVAAPRDPRNACWLYGPAELDRLRVIRLLFRAGFGAAAVLRALNHLDAGRAGDPRRVLDTPPPEEDVRHTTDRWLTTLAEQEERAREIVKVLEDKYKVLSTKDKTD